MESSDVFSQHDAASEAPSARPRRMSMDEDIFYRELMTSRPAEPPSYETAMRAAVAAQRKALATAHADVEVEADVLPQYSCGVHIEGVFMRKMEIEETIKRAEYRGWQMVYVEVRGTALHVYNVKKERGWWSNRTEGPDISPDSPPWVKKGTLEKSYSLLHADAGIAADYRKRRYVIRLRAETDQFLLSCVELGTFVKWLDRIFAAIDVAAPIDERDFPRDQSIPRIQRIRWLRGQRPRAEDNSAGFPRLNERRQSITAGMAGGTTALGDDDDDAAPPIEDDEDGNGGGEPGVEPPDDGHTEFDPFSGRTEHPMSGRLSTTSYPNEHVDPDTGKWRPITQWTTIHDQLYAKLCYAVLLFKSPRKSNYVISSGKRWYVDWDSGRMVRVLPPAYDDPSRLYGPWQVIAPESRLI